MYGRHNLKIDIFCDLTVDILLCSADYVPVYHSNALPYLSFTLSVCIGNLVA